MRKQEQGFALVITLLIAALVGTLVTGSLLLSVVNRRISSNDALSTQALNVAQAGSAFWKAELVSLYSFMMQNFDLYEDDIAAYIAAGNTPPITCDNYFAIGLDLNRDGTIDTGNASTATKSSPQPLSPSVPIAIGDNTGEALVSFYIAGSAIGLRSRGTFAGSRATVVEEFTLTQASIWNNAVFMSTSAADATIQGRAEIRGSIHILGENVPSTSIVLDVSGNFDLGNNYEGLVSSVAADVTATSNNMRLTNQRPHDLCATLRVKKGRVEMGGSSKIGSATNSDVYVDNMRGIYTNHGFIGATDSNVFSVNGRDAKYDVGDIYDFPDLADFTSDSDFTSTQHPFPEIQKRWQDKLRDNSLVLSAGLLTNPLGPIDDRVMLPHLKSDIDSSNDTTFTPAGGWATGKTYLSKSCTDTSLFGSGVGLSSIGIVTSITGTNFSLSAGTTTAFSCRKYRVTFPNTTPHKATDEVVTEVIWSGPVGGSMVTSSGSKTFGPNELYVGGKGGGVMFWGKDLNISGTNNAKVGYYGTGVLFAEDSNRENTGTLLVTGGNISLTGDFVPAKSSNDNWALASNELTGRLETLGPNPATKNTYPATTVVGLIARQNVSSGGAQRRLSTAIYAEQEVAVTQQTVIAGSIVTKRFDAGSQVPTVLFVPTLPQKLPKLMPGTNGTTLSVSNTAWNRR